MLVANHQAGRLLETRGEGAVTYAEFVTFRSSFQEFMARALKAAPQAIAIGDLRSMDALGADVAPAVLGMLRADNTRLERSAHLVSPGTAFHRQYAAIVGATKNPNRQVFTEVPALISWLGEVLQPEESARLRAMLR